MENKLGAYLRKRRGNMSLREFSMQCQISHTHLDSIEKGADPRTGKRVAISTETLRLIADGIDVDYLFLACLADGVDPENVNNVKVPADYFDSATPLNIPIQGKNGALTMDSFTYAMHEEGKELTEENKQKLIEMAQFFKQQQERGQQP